MQKQEGKSSSRVSPEQGQTNETRSFTYSLCQRVDKDIIPHMEEHMIPPSISLLTGFAQLENLTLHMFHGQMTRLRKT
ncbi:hypothetical protein L3X38_007222 [Prunus dulcis]|uniref:Uncharacterized protein n=1 Tax=Prunus dulcis TaxID=3755 RepID=A0AAD4ZUE0_PRUDU|nr:hypothetical protein L3X38_007222 [Prunus dulcis]